MEDKLSIRVNIADRYYPLKIDRGDEEKIRKAARMINDRVLQYKQRYTDKDVQDFLAMASLQYVIKVIECESSMELTPMLDELRGLNEDLDEFIKREY